MLQQNNNVLRSSEQGSSSDEDHTSVSDLRKLLEMRFSEVFLYLKGEVMPAIQGVDGRVMKLEHGMERLLIGTKSDVIEIKAQSSGPRCLKLVFRSKISLPVLNGEEIKGEGGKCLEVALVDDVSGNVVDFGREACAHVEIVALEGDSDYCERDDWVPGNYKNKNACVNEEKKPVLMGPVKLKLNKGIGSLVNVKFRNSSNHNSGLFKLGAKVVDSFDGTLVKDAMTESFVVKDFREKYKQKHYPPSLSDEIWRLENIQKGGKIYERAKQQVKTVEDFLIQLLKDPEGLKRLLGLPEKKWKATVDHAQTCPINQKVYCSINSQGNKGVVVNVVGKILGLTKDQNYVHYDMLSQEDKVEARKLLEQKEEVKDFDNQDSLLQYLSCQSINSLRPEINVIHEVETSTIGGSDQANIDASSQEAPLQFNIGTDCQEAGATGPEASPYYPTRMDQSNINEMNLNAASVQDSVLQEAKASMFDGFDIQEIFPPSSPTAGDIGLEVPLFTPYNEDNFDADFQKILLSLNSTEVEASDPKPHGFGLGHGMEMETNYFSTPDKQFPPVDQDNVQPFSSLLSDNNICPTEVHAGPSTYSNNMSSEGSGNPLGYVNECVKKEAPFNGNRPHKKHRNS